MREISMVTDSPSIRPSRSMMFVIGM